MTGQEEWQEYQRQIRGSLRERTRKGGVTKTAFQQREFTAVDGEGVTRNGRHDYVLLRVGDAELCHNDGRRLSTFDCLDYLAGQNPNRIYIGYYFDYDVTKILQGLPLERQERLIRREERARKSDPGSCYPVEWGPFAFDYLKGKEFRVRKGDGPWIVISDVGPFFQCSFVKALKAWFGTFDEDKNWHGESPELETVINKISEGKDQRSDFGGLSEYMREYCELECIMLKGLMYRFSRYVLFPKSQT